jgi:hypothetical protein
MKIASLAMDRPFPYLMISVWMKGIEVGMVIHDITKRDIFELKYSFLRAKKLIELWTAMTPVERDKDILGLMSQIQYDEYESPEHEQERLEIIAQQNKDFAAIPFDEYAEPPTPPAPPDPIMTGLVTWTGQSQRPKTADTGPKGDFDDMDFGDDDDNYDDEEDEP